MIPTIAQQKQQLRLTIKALMYGYSPEDLSTFSQNICQQLTRIINTKKMRNIAVFAPGIYEPNIWSVIEWLWQQNVHTSFPKINKDTGTLVFYEVAKKEDLIQGEFGILEPQPKLPMLDLKTLEMIIVPGIAFDRSGNRLGRSKGFYDKFLHTLSNATEKIGVCFPFQLVEKIPVEQWDIKMETVVSGK